MKITIELLCESGKNVTKEDVQINIDAIKSIICGSGTSFDYSLLMDTITILRSIQEQCPSKK